MAERRVVAWMVRLSLPVVVSACHAPRPIGTLAPVPAALSMASAGAAAARHDTIGVFAARPGERSHLAVIDWRAPGWHRIAARIPMSADSVAAWAATRRGRPVLYVHGAGTSGNRAVRQGATLARRGGHDGATLVFTWPTHAIGVTWPRSRAVLAQAYLDDSLAAVGSDSTFHATLATLRAHVPPDSLVLVAHSLGARLVARSLASSGRAARVGTVALLAGDIGTASFIETFLPGLRAATQRRVVYVGDRDRLLWLSRILHGESRIGERRSAALLAAADVEVVDMSAVPLRGALFRLVGTRHAVTRLDGAIGDLFGSVIAGGARDAAIDSLGVARLRRRGM
jgi:pimeloyl-ACP methyl ester carboxylesterase